MICTTILLVLTSCLYGAAQTVTLSSTSSSSSASSSSSSSSSGVPVQLVFVSAALRDIPKKLVYPDALVVGPHFAGEGKKNIAHFNVAHNILASQQQDARLDDIQKQVYLCACTLVKRLTERCAEPYAPTITKYRTETPFLDSLRYAAAESWRGLASYNDGRSITTVDVAALRTAIELLAHHCNELPLAERLIGFPSAKLAALRKSLGLVKEVPISAYFAQLPAAPVVSLIPSAAKKGGSTKRTKRAVAAIDKKPKRQTTAAKKAAPSFGQSPNPFFVVNSTDGSDL